MIKTGAEKSLLNKRIVWVDNAKAIAMFCIVLGHIMVESFTQSIVYSFHIPTFFFLAGYCFHDRLPFPEYVVNKLKRIMVPYFFFGLAAIFFYIVYGTVTKTETLSWQQCLLGLAVGSVKSNRMQFNYHLWFLPALFVMSVVFYALKRAADAAAKKIGCKKNLAYWIFTVLLFAAVYPFLDWNVKKYLPWGADTALRLLPFYSLGFCVSGLEIRSLSLKKYKGKAAAAAAVLAGSAACMVFAAWQNVKLNLDEDGFMVNYMRDKYGSKPLFLIAALAGIICVTAISVLMPENKAIVYFGQHTMPVLLIQKFPIMIFRILIEKMNIQNIWLYSAFVLVLCVLTILLCLAADAVIQRWLPFLYGKSRKKKNKE